MAFAQFAFKWLRGGVAPLGAIYGRDAVHNGRVADTGPQVHIEFMQRLLELLARGPTICDPDGWDAVRCPAVRNIYEGFKNSRGVYVQRYFELRCFFHSNFRNSKELSTQ